jgi:hypothetical protein
MNDLDGVLWWAMVGTAVFAAASSILATCLDRWAPVRVGSRGRFILHMSSYVLLSLSVLAFALRGLLVDY